MAAGMFGLPLPSVLADDDTFTAAAAFVIESEGYTADPNGFFQLSWGLWNSQSTGLNRTGDPSTLADTFELIEFDYFPNVSPFFGGPFVGPSVFGSAMGADAFANFTSLFGLEATLPLDVPLLAVMEHRPDLDALTVGVYRIVDSARVLPLTGVVGVVPLEFLAQRQYEVDTLGLTLWHDGFGGATPAVQATLVFHALTVTTGLPDRPEQMLQLDSGDDEADDDDDEHDD